MTELNKRQLNEILDKHEKWLNNNGGKKADLRDAVLRLADLRRADLSDADLRDAVLRLADLRRADLSDAVLRDADLRLADLSDAVLRDAVLRDADLSGAVLRDAVLRDADLSGAVLRRADLRDADLSGADLRDAVLRDADLSGVDLSGAELPPYERLPDSGSFTAYKGAGGYVVRLRVPADAGRVSCLTGPKCRVEYAVVKEILDTDGETADVDSVRGNYDEETVYEAGEEVHPDEYDGDIRLECSHGIHCFPTFREATEWI